MTTQTEALKLMLEALRMPCNYWNKTQYIKVQEAIKAGEEVVAQPEQEPVAWMFEFPDKRLAPKFDSAPHGGNWQPLYKEKNT